MKERRICGIYKIINKINGHYYVGSSKNINEGKDCRWKMHIRYLKSNRHSNDYLQNAWDKYGKSNFKLIIVENLGTHTSKQKLLDIEQSYLDIAKLDHSKGKCYNLCFKATGGKVSKYSEKKKSDSLKQTYKNNPQIKKDHGAFMKIYFSNPKNKKYLQTLKYKEKLSKAQKKRFSNKYNLNKHIKMMRSPIIKKKLSDGVKLWNKNNPEKRKLMDQQRIIKTIHTFSNKNTNSIFKGTQYDFRQKYNLHKSSVGNLIKGRNKFLHGWMLK